MQAGELPKRVKQVVDQIQASVFVGKGDVKEVPKIYQKYVAGIVHVLQRTLAFGRVAGAASVIPLAPNFPAPLPVLSDSYPEYVDDSMRFEPGQLLLRRPHVAAGEGRTQVLVIAKEGGRFERAIGGDVVELSISFDDCDQVVLPWYPLPTTQSGAVGDIRAVQKDVERLNEIRKHYKDACNKCEGASKQKAAQEVGKAAKTVVQLLAVLSLDKRFTSELSKSVMRASDITQLTGAIGEIELESLGAKILLRTGTKGARLYAGGSALNVRLDGRWVDAEVVDSTTVRTESGEVPLRLHPWNHAPRRLPSSSFEELRSYHVAALRSDHAHVFDALTGTKLDVLEQCVAIGVDRAAESGANDALTEVTNASSLAAWLHQLHAQLCAGDHTERPAGVLLTGRPASGKTSLLSQVVMHSIDRDGGELVPIVIKVQVLQTRLLAEPNTFSSAWNWVDGFLRLEHKATGLQRYHMLRQAMMARRALLLLDGLDEGGLMRSKIERHVLEVLAPQGHTIFATSRPRPAKDTEFDGFHRLQLLPLTEEQQKLAVERRLGVQRAQVLLPYLQDKVPRDEEQNRITNNPLVLSMMISMFELRQGMLTERQGMPETVVELYEEATKAMLSRAGSMDRLRASIGDDAQAFCTMRDLVQAIFFKAHVAETRVITKEMAWTAVQQLPGSTKAFDLLIELVKQDQMPLLSLLEDSQQELTMQAAHLSFQEFFAARAICKGSQLQTPPWQLPQWWLHSIRFGVEMYKLAGEQLQAGVSRSLDEHTPGGERPWGDKFVAGLLQAAGVFQDALNGETATSVQVPRISASARIDVLTSALALGSVLRAKAHIDEARVDRAVLPLSKLRADLTELTLTDVGDCDLAVLAGVLEAGRQSKSWTLSLKRSTQFGHDGATALARAPSLTRVDLTQTKMGNAQMVAIGRALLDCADSFLRSLNCAAFDLPVGANTMSGRKNMGDAGAVLLAGVLKFNNVLTELNLRACQIGDQGASDLAKALKANAVVTTVDLLKNNIGNEAATRLAEVLQQHDTLTTLCGIKPDEMVDLSQDALGPADGFLIAADLRVNATCTTLHLGRNNITDQGAVALADALEANNSLMLKKLVVPGLVEKNAQLIGACRKRGVKLF